MFRNLRLAIVPLPGLPKCHRMKVEQHRQRRAAFFSKIDEQAAGDARAVLNVGTSDPAKLAVAMMDYAPKQLLALLGESKFDLVHFLLAKGASKFISSLRFFTYGITLYASRRQ